MSKQPKNLPAKQESRAISQERNIPEEYLKSDVGLGTETIRTEDLEIPRLKLIQGLSPELEEYNQLRPGNFFHTAAEHIFSEPFLAAVIFTDRRYILWNPRQDGGGILARADDGEHWSPPDASFNVKLDKKDGGDQVTWKTARTVVESRLDQWGTLNPNDPNSPPAATLMLNFLLAFPEHPDLMPAVLTLQRSSVRVGRKFNTKLKVGGAAIFERIFEISSFKDTNKSGEDFMNVGIKGAGFATGDLYRDYRNLHLSFAQRGIQIKDLETMQDEDGANQPDEPEQVRGAGGKTRARF